MQIIHLGDCVVHADLDRITRANETRDVPRKVMAVLLVLIRRAGDVVTKEELVMAVWEGQATDEVLSTTLYELRRALGDDARKPRYIETIRKRGYRLVAPVIRNDDSGASPLHPRRRTRRIAAAGGFSALLVASFVVSATWRSSGHVSTRPDPLPPREVSAEACDAYLKGRHFLTLGTTSGLESAISYFEKAVAIQPELAIAHIGLAECYTLGDWSQLGLSWQDAYEAALNAVERARALLGHDPDVVAMLATIRFRHEWDWRGAEAEFRSVKTNVDPCRTWNQAVYAEFLSASGKHEEALGILRELLRFEPLSLRINGGLAWALYLSSDLVACRRQLEQTIELYPAESRLRELLGDVCVLTHDPDGATNAYEQALLFAGKPPSVLVELRDAALANGPEGVLRWRAARIEKAGTDANLVQLARIDALLGRPTEALGRILEAIDRRNADIVWIDQDPALEEVRALPMYRIARSRLNLAT